MYSILMKIWMWCDNMVCVPHYYIVQKLCNDCNLSKGHFHNNVYQGITRWSPHIVTLYKIIIILYNNYRVTVIDKTLYENSLCKKYFWQYIFKCHIYGKILHTTRASFKHFCHTELWLSSHNVCNDHICFQNSLHMAICKGIINPPYVLFPFYEKLHIPEPVSTCPNRRTYSSIRQKC
jgi:hypothetical protein